MPLHFSAIHLKMEESTYAYPSVGSRVKLPPLTCKEDWSEWYMRVQLVAKQLDLWIYCTSNKSEPPKATYDDITPAQAELIESNKAYAINEAKHQMFHAAKAKLLEIIYASLDGPSLNKVDLCYGLYNKFEQIREMFKPTDQDMLQIISDRKEALLKGPGRGKNGYKEYIILWKELEQICLDSGRAENVVVDLIKALRDNNDPAYSHIQFEYSKRRRD